MKNSDGLRNKLNRKQKTVGRREGGSAPPSLIILSVLIVGFCFIIPLIVSLISMITTPSSNEMSDPSRYIMITIIIVMLCFAVATPTGYIVGKIRAKYKIFRNDLSVRITNPYQYYRELPNDFGIGVTSLLSNSIIENEKDIIAAILDLCAQGYLRLSKHSDHYVIRRSVTTPPRTLLSNEAYLLQLIQDNAITNIDYQKWYQLCVNDGVQLGLFHPIKLPATQEKSGIIIERIEKIFRIVIVISFTAAILWCFVGQSFLSVGELESSIGIAFLVSFLTLIGATIFQIGSMIWINLRGASQHSYKNALERCLQRTDKGIAELQKLQSFRAFLAQFNTFVDKNPEAVILWERYLSYAQVFGLAKEIMRSGYSQLIDNAAFKINNISDITLSDISFSRQ